VGFGGGLARIAPVAEGALAGALADALDALR
jgi:hypothetical protein